MPLQLRPEWFAVGIAAVLGGSVTAAVPRHGALDETQQADEPDGGATTLPVQRIEDEIGAHGRVTNGVLDIGVERKDIRNVDGPLGVTFSGSFEIQGDVFFQPLPNGQALMNGDVALLPDEVNPFIGALLDQGLVFQAYHQHLIDMSPAVWFVHFRGTGDPVDVARRVRAALAKTAMPLPQEPAQDPSTPLDVDRLEAILHGHAHVGDDGVVTIVVSRRHGVTLGGVDALPETNVSTHIEMKPLGGSKAAAVSDFSMTAQDVDPVVKHMLNDLGWFQGCLYNQETDEHPQLYFDHMLKTGDAYQLARELRSGLDLTDAQ